ncbi:TetR/AcrR family transcriptional regulator [Kribbella ginsengisoli]|uniref:TetR/AcrR family transcriptional regulator n=1 Tax=Kribbella ginsengisoli TaxID=363865 RepID=UPI0031D722DF
MRGDTFVALARTPRAKWIEQGLRTLADGGPEAVRIEAIAQALGVTKGGFYGYFENRGALLEEMLDSWELGSTEELIQRVESEGGDAATKLHRLITIVASADRLTSEVTVDLAIRDWARRDPAVADRLRRVDNRRMAYLRELFSAFCPDPADVETRSLLVYSTYIGSHLIAADHGPYTRSEVLKHTRTWLLTPPGDSRRG